MNRDRAPKIAALIPPTGQGYEHTPRNAPRRCGKLGTDGSCVDLDVGGFLGQHTYGRFRQKVFVRSSLAEELKSTVARLCYRAAD
jgi:hypothetical protein